MLPGRLALALVTLLLTLLLSTGLLAQSLQAIPPLTGRVVDTTGTLDQATKARLESRLADFERRKGSQLVLLMVPTTEPEPTTEPPTDSNGRPDPPGATNRPDKPKG